MKVLNFKYRKCHKVRVVNGEIDYKRMQLIYGFCGLKSLQGFRLTSSQIEALRRTIKKVLKKTGVVWIRVIADRPITAKPAEVRMGKGKGNYSDSVSVIKAGTVLVELGGVDLPFKLAVAALRAVSQKLPVRTSYIWYKS